MGIRAGKPSDKPTLLDLAPAAAFISKFTERDRDIFQAWLTARGDISLAAMSAQCPEQQIWNVLRKLRRQIDQLSEGKLGRLPVRFDPRKSSRITKKVILAGHDRKLASALIADPMGTAMDLLARREATKTVEMHQRKPVSDQGNGG